MPGYSAEAASETSAPALRRRGTVGGNVTTPHAAGDIATALLALGATVHVARRHSTDEYPLADFMRLQAEQWPRQHLLVAVTVRKCKRSAFEKIGARIAFSRSLVAIGVPRSTGDSRSRWEACTTGRSSRPRSRRRPRHQVGSMPPSPTSAGRQTTAWRVGPIDSAWPRR